MLYGYAICNKAGTLLDLYPFPRLVQLVFHVRRPWWLGGQVSCRIVSEEKVAFLKLHTGQTLLPMFYSYVL